MTNQDIVDAIEDIRCVRTLPIGIREGVLDAVYTYLYDNRAEDEDSE